jgi:hypothetical protein
MEGPEMTKNSAKLASGTSGKARTKLVTGLALAAMVVGLGLTGCGRGAATAADAADTATTDLTLEAQALASIGFAPAELAPALAVVDPTPGPTAQVGDKRKDRPLRPFKRFRLGFGKKMLHGEAVVQTDEGTRTVVVQRGEVTAINDKTVTVKSTDGFSLTWTFSADIRVLERRSTVQPSAIKVGATVGVAGTRAGDAVTALLLVVPGEKPAR